MAGTLSDVERKFVDSLLQTNGESELFSGKVEVKEKKKTKDEIIVLGSYRIYLIKTGKPKVKLQIHLMDLEEVTSTTPREITIKGRRKEKEKEGAFISILNLLESVSNTMIYKLYINFKLTFPTMPVTVFPRFIVIPEERIGADRFSEEDVSPCGGFTRAYSCICDWYGIVPCEDIVWDINIIYPLNHIEKFDISEMALRKSRLTILDVKALMHALRYNDHFSCILAANYKLVNFISETLTCNASIEKLVLANVGMNKDMAVTLANALTGAGLYHLDISGNPIEDKGMNAIASALSTFRRGMLTISVARTCGKVGISTLMKALEGNPQIYLTLENLSISGIKLDEAVSRDVGSFLARAVSLRRLNISNTNISFSSLAIKRLESITFLDASGNRVCATKESHLELVRLLQHCPNLSELMLPSTGIDGDALRVIFGNTTAIVPSLETLDISDNDLGDAGMLAFIEALGNRHKIKRLKINRNWVKPTKQRPQAIQALVQFINADYCTIENLSMSGSAKNHSQLKEELLPFVFCLMTNSKLTVVDISGHQVGNSMGLALYASISMATQEGQKTREILYRVQNRVMKNVLGDVEKSLSASYSTESLRSRSSSSIARTARPKKPTRRSFSIDPGKATYIFKEAPILDDE